MLTEEENNEWLALADGGGQADGVERHPLRPFVPDHCRVLLLGSFPPPRSRWCMNFYYPNFINDHWRIEGLIFYGDRDHFVDTERRRFRLDEIVAFLRARGIGLYDAATAVRRLRDNASDQYLDVVEPTDVTGLLRAAPQCAVVATTGERSCLTLCGQLGIDRAPRVGTSANARVEALGRTVTVWRLPSSSRAYPLSLAAKAEAYRAMYESAGLIAPRQ